ncbi:helix-turn-helix domain-containing protein [Hippea maritima]|uniref:Helix-turn-helix domain protein n=1 Tax=Hippea maritima (strain ATCC 700847 / DSM 10411 / MH2) TaxID=760142 RepID=F2LV75_HIPMA|nr:helix-turn-helix domain-containing protein [Hippea maritima]AEA33659.1 helix-turn-helix domain protein [Hippea maritima DSM 10411]
MDEEMDIKIKATNRKSLIKALLTAKGIKITDIAKELGVAVTTVSLVISGRDTSKRIQTTIAKKLGVDVNELWPKVSVSKSKVSKSRRR